MRLWRFALFGIAILAGLVAVWVILAFARPYEYRGSVIDTVVTLYRRIAAKRILYPNYRLAHVAIDSLRAIGNDEALTALTEVLSLPAVWQTEKFCAMKTHALRCISRMKGERSRAVLEETLRSSDRHLRIEAQRIIYRLDL